MFSFDGVVLKKIKVKDNKHYISVFSKEYGKISAWHTESKSKISIDIGNIYNFSSKTDNGINKIDSFKTKNIINTASLGYREINNILQINFYLEKVLPNGMVLENIFDNYVDCSKYFELNEENKKSSVFFTLKLLKTLGIAKTPEISDSSKNFIKIFGVIDIYKISVLMKIEGLDNSIFEEIEKFNTNTLTYYIN
ncbi:MAG: recombination protein O N-terminal domain-containing protein [Candidatus Gracilibacteria bacterium]|nr:recombination protein O N-terminal domain-containing protein [Candidatus Gracilibacteria bacterium]MDD2908332.1 recombination protein O N-terminal domain-containing protein [Candidatus Gracilibacteria bacterium]